MASTNKEAFESYSTNNLPNDPFNDPSLGQETSSSWTIASSLDVTTPRWQLLTDQEKTEQNKTLDKLESKLKRLNQKKSKPTYTSHLLSDTSSTHFSDSDDELDHDKHVENEEGLPLLWNTTLDQAPKKTEEQYNQRSLWSLCCCCFHE